jgi:2TM domain
MENRDEYLWRIAKKRAGFKKQLASYIIVNTFLWVLWFVTKNHADLDDMDGNNFPWPIWSTLGWGIGLAFSYYNAYHDTKEVDTIKEYQKLKDREANK